MFSWQRTGGFFKTWFWEEGQLEQKHRGKQCKNSMTNSHGVFQTQLPENLLPHSQDPLSLLFYVLLLDYHSSRQPAGEGGLRASSCPHGVWPHSLERKRNEQWNDRINCLLPDPFPLLSIFLSRRNLGPPPKLLKHISPQRAGYSVLQTGRKQGDLDC